MDVRCIFKSILRARISKNYVSIMILHTWAMIKIQHIDQVQHHRKPHSGPKWHSFSLHLMSQTLVCQKWVHGNIQIKINLPTHNKELAAPFKATKINMDIENSDQCFIKEQWRWLGTKDSKLFWANPTWVKPKYESRPELVYSLVRWTLIRPYPRRKMRRGITFLNHSLY